jgi:hypothetical protein
MKPSPAVTGLTAGVTLKWSGTGLPTVTFPVPLVAATAVSVAVMVCAPAVASENSLANVLVPLSPPAPVVKV